MTGARAIALAASLAGLSCGASPPPREARPREAAARAPAGRRGTSGGEVLAAPGAPAEARSAAQTPRVPTVAVGQVLRGPASYYHDSLAGNLTANGERYLPHALTAASRTLPFGTRVRVTRIDTGASVVVRVNDRGPFGNRGRILDLSRAAAERLGMIRAGVVEVEAEILEVGAGRRRRR